MSELEPTDTSRGLEELRMAKLSPHAARMVVWSAGLRLMSNKIFTGQQLRQAGVFVETIFGTADAIEEEERRYDPLQQKPVPMLLDMGNTMGWAAAEVRRAEFYDSFNPSSRVHQRLAIQMQLTIGVIEQYVANAYLRYMAYEEAQRRDPRQTEIKWY